MEVTITINGQAVSVQVSLEVYHFLNEANRKEENLLHEQRRHWDGRGLDEAALTHPSGVETPEQRLCRKETMQEIMAVLDACTPTQRERFLLYALHGMRYEQIGRLHGCSKNAVHASICAIRKKFKQYYANRLHESPFSG